jgi:hypothetical protein
MKALSARFCGSCAVLGTLLCLFLFATLHLLRPDYNPSRRFMSEYLVGPFGFLGTVAVFLLAATLIMLLIGLRRSVRPCGSLSASCVLLGVMVISASVCAVFPIDVLRPDGSHSAFTWACITHLASSAVLYVSLVALLFTLSSAYRRDENWRSFSYVTLFLGFFMVASLVVLIVVPVYLRGLAQRVISLPVLIGCFLLVCAFDRS